VKKAFTLTLGGLATEFAFHVTLPWAAKPASKMVPRLSEGLVWIFQKKGARMSQEFRING